MLRVIPVKRRLGQCPRLSLSPLLIKFGLSFNINGSRRRGGRHRKRRRRRRRRAPGAVGAVSLVGTACWALLELGRSRPSRAVHEARGWKIRRHIGLSVAHPQSGGLGTMVFVSRRYRGRVSKPGSEVIHTFVLAPAPEFV